MVNFVLGNFYLWEMKIIGKKDKSNTDKTQNRFNFDEQAKNR